LVRLMATGLLPVRGYRIIANDEFPDDSPDLPA